MDLGFLFAFSVDVSSESIGVNVPTELVCESLAEIDTSGVIIEMAELIIETDSLFDVDADGFVVSFSGDTEDGLSAYALGRGRTICLGIQFRAN